MTTVTGLVLLVATIAILCTACGASTRGSPPTAVSNPTTSSTITTGSQRAASREWLGLNYNSGTQVGTVGEFSRQGIVYDRLGALEVSAGTTISNSATLARGLHVSLSAGMIPDLLIDPVLAPHGCTTDPEPSKLCLPVTPLQIRTYVRGFVATARSILRAYPRRGIAFEPLDEPWNWPAPSGTPSGRIAAEEYAAILASLLPSAQRAGIPLSAIYVPVTGALDDGTSWVEDLYGARPCLRPGHGSCGPIEAWNAHPYGLPTDDSRGISELPKLREEMASGADNIIISELGFCSKEVDGGQNCDTNVSQVDGNDAQTTRWLRDTLNVAAAMHRAGWLRALILWVRNGGGWSMQTTDGHVTPQGEVLLQFAAGQQRAG